MSTANLRRVNGYVLATMPTTAQVRKVNGYALAQVGTPTWTLDGQSWLLKLFNNENGYSYTSSQLTFSNPQTRSDPRFNSQVDCTAGSSLSVSGTMQFYYQRWDINLALVGKSATTSVSYSSTLVKSLAEINSKFGLALVAADVVDQAIPSGTTQLTLEIASTSLMYLPGTKVTLGAPTTLASNFPSTDLDGFDPA